MRTQAKGFALPPQVRPQVFDPPQLANWARYASLRTQRFPDLAAAADAYRRSGMPIMRHMVLVAPEDREATGRHDQFLFGPDLLAAPVLEPGATARSLYLPAGTWVDRWRSGTWDAAAGAFVLAAATRLDGPGSCDSPIAAVGWSCSLFPAAIRPPRSATDANVCDRVKLASAGSWDGGTRVLRAAMTGLHPRCVAVG